MSKTTVKELPNGLRVERLPLEGTRAITVLVAFEAGSRAEERSENGIAHFVEHLVFKGGHSYPTHREINATAERIGARVNAWTSDDLVVFRVRCRAEGAPEAIDLLTDFVGRPAIDPDELERERGVVIQEIARNADRPQDRADDLIMRAAFGEHPYGRSILGTAEQLQGFGRESAISFRERQWSGQRGRVLLVGNLSMLPDEEELAEHFGRFPTVAPPPAPKAVPPSRNEVLVEQRDSSQTQLRLLYRPAIDPGDRHQRAALTVFRTLLGGSQGSVLFDEIREQRGLAYSAFARDHAFADGVMVQVSAGVDSARAIETHETIRELIARLGAEGPSAEHAERARAYAAGRRVLAFENTDVVADHAAEEGILFGHAESPDEAIAALDAVSYDDVAAVARSLGDAPALAVVGPHSAGEFA